MCALCWVACALVIIGALNWGLVGLGYFLGKADQLNLVTMIVGGTPQAVAAVYILVGLGGVVVLIESFKK